MSYITIPNGDQVETYQTDTDDQIAEAQAALRDAGLDSAQVFNGHPDDPDSYPGGMVIWATPRELADE